MRNPESPREGETRLRLEFWLLYIHVSPTHLPISIRPLHKLSALTGARPAVNYSSFISCPEAAAAAAAYFQLVGK